MTREELIAGFDDIRPSFLAALDQVIAELRPILSTGPAYDRSVLGCAAAFADPVMVRRQFLAIDPELASILPAGEIAEVHRSILAYLFSLTLHELVRAEKTLPSPTEGDTP